MRLFQSLTAVGSCALLCMSAVTAHSTARNPLNYLALVEDPRIHTHNQRVTAYSSFDLTFDLHKHAQHIRLSLHPSEDILGEDSFIQHIDKDGNVKSAEKIERLDHKVYQGKAYVVDEEGVSENVGWARISVLRDGIHPVFQGAFTLMGDHHNIQMKSNYMSSKHPMDPDLEDDEDEYMAVFRNSDISRSSHSELRKRMESPACASDRLAFNNNPEHPIFSDSLKRSESSWGTMPIPNLLGKRQIDGGGAGNGNSAGVNLRSTIGDTSGCPKSRQVALVGVATDCGYTASFNGTEALRFNVIDVVNTASELYQTTFNITLGLRNLTLSDAECPSTASTATPWNIGCAGSTDLDSRLNSFSAWRGNLAGDTNAYWSLFTSCNSGAEVGLAWLGQLCNHGATNQQSNGNTQSVTGANVVAKTSTEWQVFAHESGHTFGAVHDCDAQTCANSQIVSSSQCCPLSSTQCDANAQYMMNPYSASDITRFSPCSIGNICSALGRNSVNGKCLTDNRDVTTITGQQCGNGIVEEGEECDCGGETGCAGNSCCDPTTCKFTQGSVCDPSNEGCCSGSCQFSSSGTICRASTGQCDPAETCSGSNGTCPPDLNTPDGTNCGNGLQCASGQCTSRDQQCKTVMGTYLQGNDTYACDSQGCVISCGSPEFGANTCYRMQQNFLDGTSCGGGGRCSNGVCDGSTTAGEIRSWINDNKTLVIALASSIGGLLLLAILGCIWRAFRTRKNGGRRRRHARPGPRPQYWNGPPIPPNMAQRGYGSSPAWHPQQPPPAYGGQGLNGGYGPSGTTFRYA